jgi:hypothetical protein
MRFGTPFPLSLSATSFLATSSDISISTLKTKYALSCINSSVSCDDISDVNLKLNPFKRAQSLIELLESWWKEARYPTEDILNQPLETDKPKIALAAEAFTIYDPSSVDVVSGHDDIYDDTVLDSLMVFITNDIHFFNYVLKF